MNIAKIKEIAITEIITPKLKVTEQFFAVHDIDDKDPIKYIERDDEQYLVFVGIKNEPFYWVVKIEEKNNTPIVTWGHCNPYSRIYFSITSSSIPPETITRKLKLDPTRSGKKGETWQSRKGPVPGRIFKEDLWQYEENLPDALDFEDKLNSMLDLLSRKSQELLAIGQGSYMSINVAHYVHVQYTWGWHLNNKQLSHLNGLGLELDVDLYASGNWFEC
ncbi:DUF4279 domain-containing protein [Desulfogranum japonicum]|uniref:DUF4279 domain-containing protein n=1 Tax=Desulfogranum japonicum TaxID=231447 RepID=UPI0003FFC6A5|nr:DUF4279 domain-containing protein [Desulfogranum japonicum]